MSMETNATALGSASGWSVYDAPSGTGFQWSAYGPGGGTHGSAKTRAEAQRKAQAECEHLKKMWRQA